MKVLFYLGHPAHYHLFKNPIRILRENGIETIQLIKKKDILEDLLKSDKLDYINVYPKERRNSTAAISISLVKRDIALLKIVKRFKPDLMIGTSAEITHIGRLKRIPSVVVNEDDADVVPKFVKLSYPFASQILLPTSCSAGKYKNKSIFYNGYHELAYLNTKYFTPDKKVLNQLELKENEKFFLLRFAKLTAHHDQGKTGITDEIAEKIIDKLNPERKVFITSERELKPRFEEYRIKINPAEMHSVLNYATLYIGDSQTMAAEAAVLGTPSIRFNDFVGKLGYLEELEQKFNLTFGIKTSDQNRLFEKIDELLALPNLKEEWKNRKEKMLSEKIDVTAFMVWFIENYPDSVKVMRKNPDYQYRFR